MKNNNKCFCGNHKNLGQCHQNIRQNSRFAKLYKLYNKVDREIKTKVQENNLKTICQKGCNECCHQLFNISEVEFCIIADYVSDKFNKKQQEAVFEKGLMTNEYLKKNNKDYLKKLEFNSSGMLLAEGMMRGLMNNPEKTPIGCVFLNEKNECSIYKVRPLVCRTHGVAYLNDESNDICSKLSISDINRNNFVDLRHYEKEYTDLLTFVLESVKKGTVRRPYPIFYWINYLHENNMSFAEMKDTVLFARYTIMEEEEAIKSAFGLFP